jgi:hypothetical protein
MRIRVLEYYRAKPEFTPYGLNWLAVYVRPGELGTISTLISGS